MLIIRSITINLDMITFIILTRRFSKEGERPSSAEKPSDLQAANELLLYNKAAIDGVLLAIEAAVNSVSSSSSTTTTNFNSELGLKPKTILNLVEGFDASLVRTLYATTGYDMAKTIILIFSNKKIQKLEASDITSITSMKNLLTTVLKVQIETEITSVQKEITDAGETVKTTEVTKLTFPMKAEEEDATEASTNAEDSLLVILKNLIATKDGLEKSITAINKAISSSSTTGVSGAKVIEFAHSVEALSAALYGADLENSIIQKAAVDLVKVTIVTASAKVTTAEQVRRVESFSVSLSAA